MIGFYPAIGSAGQYTNSVLTIPLVIVITSEPEPLGAPVRWQCKKCWRSTWQRAMWRKSSASVKDQCLLNLLKEKLLLFLFFNFRRKLWRWVCRHSQLAFLDSNLLLLAVIVVFSGIDKQYRTRKQHDYAGMLFSAAVNCLNCLAKENHQMIHLNVRDPSWSIHAT